MHDSDEVVLYFNYLPCNIGATSNIFPINPVEARTSIYQVVTEHFFQESSNKHAKLARNKHLHCTYFKYGVKPYGYFLSHSELHVKRPCTNDIYSPLGGVESIYHCLHEYQVCYSNNYVKVIQYFKISY